MTDTTLEEAKRCPTCGEPGRLLNRRRPAPQARLAPGTVVEMYECTNDRCKDYVGPELILTPNREGKVPEERLRWAIQVNPDGTIPPKGSGAMGPKVFDSPGAHTVAAQRARDHMRMLAMQDEDPQGAYEIQRDLGY